MRNISLLVLFLSLFMFSCEAVEEEILPIIGVYEANVIGIYGPFSLSISADGGDNILIEAPFDGNNWEVIPADVDNEGDFIKDIEFFSTQVADGVVIDGDGFYNNNTIQLDYEVVVDGHSTGYTIVATKQ